MKELENTLDLFKKAIPEGIKYEVMVVGSMALRAHGFKNIIPQDIDIEIKCEDKRLVDFLQGLQVATDVIEALFLTNYPPVNGRFDFKFNNIRFNVWVSSSFEIPDEDILRKGSNLYTPIYSILSYKKRYARPKDYLMMNKMVMEILK